MVPDYLFKVAKKKQNFGKVARSCSSAKKLLRGQKVAKKLPSTIWLCLPAFPHSPIPAFPHSRIPAFPHSRIPPFPFPILKIAIIVPTIPIIVPIIDTHNRAYSFKNRKSPWHSTSDRSPNHHRGWSSNTFLNMADTGNYFLFLFH